MFKIQNIFLLIFLTTILNPIHARGGGSHRGGHMSSFGHGGGRTFPQGHRGLSSFQRSGSIVQNELDRERLIEAIATNFDKVKEIVATGAVDLNGVPPRGTGPTILGKAILSALYNEPQPFRLEVIEFLLQHGGDINGVGIYGMYDNTETPLAQVIGAFPDKNNIESYFQLIRLLLGYGAIVNDKIVELAKNSEYHEQIMKMLVHHLELLKKAKTNPNEDLLMEAIGYNKPYVVQLIVDNKPELVTWSDIELAKKTSPASVSILTKAFKFAELRGLAKENERPQQEQLSTEVRPTQFARGGLQMQAPNERLHEELMNAIEKANIDQIEVAIQLGVDINQKESGPGGSTPLNLAIDRAGYSLNQGNPDSEIRLFIVELLIQAGASINAEGEWGYTPLEKALVPDLPILPIIKLLLGYGANITEKALKMTELRSNAEELMRIFDIRQMLLKQVQSNPTEELLKVTIRFNKPYFVQLIVGNKPELVTLSDIELAQETSPASVPILTKAMEIVKLWKIGSERGMPAELTQYIEKIITHNK